METRGLAAIVHKGVSTGCTSSPIPVATAGRVWDLKLQQDNCQAHYLPTDCCADLALLGEQ